MWSKCGWYLGIKTKDTSRKRHTNFHMEMDTKFLTRIVTNNSTTCQEGYVPGQSEISPRNARVTQYAKINHYNTVSSQNKEKTAHDNLRSQKGFDKIQQPFMTLK